MPAGLGVSLIVLAGCCSTGRSGPAEQESQALPSVARELVSHGVQAVVAMQGPVGDRYATELGGALLDGPGQLGGHLPAQRPGGAAPLSMTPKRPSRI